MFSDNGGPTQLEYFTKLVTEQAAKIRDLCDEVVRQKERANSSDDQLVWLAMWCKNKFDIISNTVIGSEGWPHTLVEVVAQAVDAKVARLDRERQDFHMTYRMKCDAETKALQSALAAAQKKYEGLYKRQLVRNPERGGGGGGGEEFINTTW
ncbi:MAG: hypothetical protein E4H07_04950 [Nitrosomonadales bacterium]|nr:MAG: hypothetical protein E4H07_04950 [Nitrosomonadales bacterium]